MENPSRIAGLMALLKTSTTTAAAAPGKPTVTKVMQPSPTEWGEVTNAARPAPARDPITLPQKLPYEKEGALTNKIKYEIK